MSWLQQLLQDPEAVQFTPNKTSREVKSGHYVPVMPTPLPCPKLLAISPDVCRAIGLSADFCRESEEFLRYVSGDMHAFSADKAEKPLQSWATPYALSIQGHELYDNCPFKTGNGYGDGRAISIGEFLVHNEDNERSQRWELQLKGAGTTPFCRGGDGRAVLRSSIREFLAEEALHHLGVPTTRGLSLAVSTTEQVSRPWFRPGGRPRLTIDDPRIMHYSLSDRKEILREINGQPDVLIAENVAIACRVAPSFLRVGHIELFYRRYRDALAGKGKESDVTSKALLELRLITEHMLFREFSGAGPAQLSSGHHTAPVEESLQIEILEALKESSRRISYLTAQWVRVGFCQGNFNSDNCLVGGRTLDLGPFGFIERYDRQWCMWSGGGEKYSFRKQHIAGDENFKSLAKALLPLLSNSRQQEVLDTVIPAHLPHSEKEICCIFKEKLGLVDWDESAQLLFEEMDSLMEECEADYTLFWRQLSSLPESVVSREDKDSSAGLVVKQCSDASLLEPLCDVFYGHLSQSKLRQWSELLRKWLKLLCAQHVSASSSGSTISSLMREVNPKFVPREWMLVEAYTAAARGDYAPLQRLQHLFSAPYEEHSEDDTSKYYRKMPPEMLDTGGVTTMP